MKKEILISALLLSPAAALADNVSIGPDGSINVENQYGDKTSVSASGNVVTQDRYGETSAVTSNGVVSKDRYGTTSRVTGTGIVSKDRYGNTTTINHPVASVPRTVKANPYVPAIPATTTVMPNGQTSVIQGTAPVMTKTTVAPNYVSKSDSSGNSSVTTPGHIVTRDAQGNVTEINGKTGTITKTYASPATGQATIIQDEQNDTSANNGVNINASGVHINDAAGNRVNIGGGSQ